MKLSAYAKKIGVTYTTAYRMFNRGELDAYQLPSGTIVVNETAPNPQKVALYARVSSSSQKDDLERQVERLKDFVAAQGLAVDYLAKEVASGLNDQRPRLKKILENTDIGIVVVEHKERLTRFGFNYIETLLNSQDRKIVVMYPDEIEDDLVQDFIAIITSMCARIYGRRGNKGRSRKVIECIENANS